MQPDNGFSENSQKNGKDWSCRKKKVEATRRPQSHCQNWDASLKGHCWWQHGNKLHFWAAWYPKESSVLLSERFQQPCVSIFQGQMNLFVKKTPEFLSRNLQYMWKPQNLLCLYHPFSDILCPAFQAASRHLQSYIYNKNLPEKRQQVTDKYDYVGCCWLFRKLCSKVKFL